MVKSKRSDEIRKAFAEILARRAARGAPLKIVPPEEKPTEAVPPPPPSAAPPLRRIPSAEEGWGPKKGELLEVQTLEGEWQAAVVVKEPLHRRWFHVYSPEFGQLYKRVPLARLRASIYSVEGSKLTLGKAFKAQVWEPKKGEEVLVHPESPQDGEPAVATITKVPFHRRWYHLYQQETKQRMRRVPANRLSKYNYESYETITSSPLFETSPESDLEATDKPSSADAAESMATGLNKGDIVYAMIDGKKERVALLNLPEGEDIASVYILSSSKDEARMHRVPLSDIIGPVDDPAETPVSEESLVLNRGDYVEAEIGGFWLLVIVTKVPKHRRWYHVKTMGDFEEESRVYKRIPARRIRKFNGMEATATLNAEVPTPAPPSVCVTPDVLEFMVTTLRENNINPARVTQSYLQDTFPKYASMINKSVWNVIVAEIAPTRM